MLTFRNIILTILISLMSSCDLESITDKKEKKYRPKKTCPIGFNFNKKTYSVKDPEIVQLFSKIDAIDLIIHSKKVRTKEKNVTKFSSFTVYSKDRKNLKIISDIYIRDINLSATKHEIFFIDECNIVAKMTKYAYRSTRIKSIYYFLYYNRQYKGCIVSHHHSIFHKKDNWFNISGEKLSESWGKRIFNNIIKNHLQSLN